MELAELRNQKAAAYGLKKTAAPAAHTKYPPGWASVDLGWVRPPFTESETSENVKTQSGLPCVGGAVVSRGAAVPRAMCLGVTPRDRNNLMA